MSKIDPIEAILLSERTSVIAESKGPVEAPKKHVEVVVESPALKGVDPKEIGAVSAELEIRRSINYQNIGIKIWANSPCVVGDEEQQLNRVIDVLHRVAGQYEEDSINPTLDNWS